MAGRFIDLTGQRFGRLTVTRRTQSNKNSRAWWECTCDCGGLVIIDSKRLKSGHTKSCGCYQRTHRITHGQSRSNGKKTKLYSVWTDIKQRCYNQTHAGYKRYGGRGIKICNEWVEFEAFYTWAMSNGYQDGLSIDRIDVNGNYCPENCRWATDNIQQNNRRDNFRILCPDGQIRTLTTLALLTGINKSTLQSRVDKYPDITFDQLTRPLSQGVALKKYKEDTNENNDN